MEKNNSETYDVCLVGLGPAGQGFLYNQIQIQSNLKIVALDAGPNISERNCPVLNNEFCNLKSVCHVIGGFGGSSVLAGGKLSSYPAGNGLVEIVKDKDYLTNKIKQSREIYASKMSLLSSFTEESKISNAKKYYKKKGFDYKYYLSELYTQEEFYEFQIELEQHFIDNCLDLRFNSKVINIEKADDDYVITYTHNQLTDKIRAKKIVLGLGKLGEKLLFNVSKVHSFPCAQNKLEIGIRVEVPKVAFEEIDKYHNDLKLKIRDCKTFCISKGGKIALYYKNGLLYTEGYDNFSIQTEFTNFGFLNIIDSKVNALTLLEDIETKRLKENAINPIRQSYLDFIQGLPTKESLTSSTIKNWKLGNIHDYLPQAVLNSLIPSLKKFIEDFISKEHHNSINLFFPEVNYGGNSYNVNSDFQIVDNCYIIGESTGKFIGILQAFTSGIICSERI